MEEASRKGHGGTDHRERRSPLKFPRPFRGLKGNVSTSPPNFASPSSSASILSSFVWQLGIEHDFLIPHLLLPHILSQLAQGGGRGLILVNVYTMTAFPLSRVSLATGTCYRYEISPVWFKWFNFSKQHSAVLKIPCLAQILSIAFISEHLVPKSYPFSWSINSVLARNMKMTPEHTAFSSLLHSARPLNYTLRWNCLNKLGSL